MSNKQLFDYLWLTVSAIFGVALALYLLNAVAGLPGPIEVAQAVGWLWRDGTLPHDLQVSTARWVLGWIIGTCLGLLIGIVTGFTSVGRRGLEGFMIVVRAVPFISLLPLSQLLFGLSEIGKISLIAWACAGTSWVIVHQGSLAVPLEVHALRRSLRIDPIRWWLGAVPSLLSRACFSAARTSLGLGLVVVAIAELAGVYERSSGLWWSEGIGYRLFRSLDEARDDVLLAAIIIFSLMGLTGDIVFRGTISTSSRIYLSLRSRLIKSMVAGISEPNEPVSYIPSRSPCTIELRGLAAGYEDRMVFENFSCTVHAGDTLVVCGTSSAGKSTLIRSIFGPPWDVRKSGSVVVTDNESAGKPSLRIGLVTQNAAVFSGMTVWSNLMLSRRMRTLPKNRRRQYGLLLLREFGLAGTEHQFAATLSGGQRQRLALAMAISDEPDFLLLDEPFGSLDALRRSQLQQFFLSHVRGVTTSLFVTHDLDEAVIIGDTIVVGVGSDRFTMSIDAGTDRGIKWQEGHQFLSYRVCLFKALAKSITLDSC